MKRFVCLLLALVALSLVGCSKATPTPAPTPYLKQQVITFSRAVAAIERDGETWNKDLDVFIQYSPGMTRTAREAKYNELVQQLNILKQRAMDVQRPAVVEAREAHDKYVQTWSKVTQIFTIIRPDTQLTTEQTRQVQSLTDEATLLSKQFYELMDDLLKKYGLTRLDVGLP